MRVLIHFISDLCNGPYVRPFPPLSIANAYQARIFAIAVAPHTEEETQSFRRAGRYLNLASFFSCVFANTCFRSSQRSSSLTARTLRVRPGRSPPSVNRALYMVHAMCRQVADFRKSLETLSRSARRSAKPAPSGYLNGP